jgi:ABC-type phosphate/phosphonate transport system substrate-binding protein
LAHYPILFRLIIMQAIPRRRSVTLIAILFLAFVATPRAVSGDSDSDAIRIGLPESLVRDLPKAVFEAGLPPLRYLMQEATGLRSTIVAPLSAEDIATQLDKKELQLAVLQGVEFAWELKRHPHLRPLAIVVNQTPDRQANLVVRKDRCVRGWADLKGTSLALPLRSLEHCHLFTQVKCRAGGAPPQDFFSRVLTPDNIEEAFDDVVDGVAGAAVVDRVGITAYARRKPGRFDKLTVFLESERFPDAVVVYRDGIFAAKTLQHFREELMKVDKKSIGRHVLSLWMVTAFEPVPANYSQLLGEIRQVYPSPLPPVLATGIISAEAKRVTGR